MLAKLFNSSELKKVAAGNFGIFHEIGDEFPELSEVIEMADFYDLAYSLLVKNYRNEYVVKNEIANKILLGRHSMNTTSMMSELRTGHNIADCLVVNGYSTCYEIKTEFDSLVRFQDQLSSYRKAYDKTYVVTHNSHIEHVLSIHDVSPIFGVIELTKRNQLKTVITAPISDEFDYDITFDTLRKPEYMFIAEQVLGDIPEMPNTKLYEYCKEAYQTLSEQNANAIFKNSLKKFRCNDHTFINALPKSLKNIGISYQLSRNEKNSLLCLLMNNASIELGDSDVLPILERKAS
ncbi:sce7726 family protein [Photobacterium rosenbergii]|uniref:Sce7726 family protein n=1 Tax=Photobacterium rosenbergii TaxID=294936 RepID=A0ABU3ZMC7_9GAMM|nr:sce7726 family protein [Photobacterium rosenbergii]MDV5171043.1 sce7726 family protein [Photobacterium rosenbergii]